jgi:hypothetical protein
MSGFSPKWLSDWWRGYSDEDVRSAHDRLAADCRPGALIFMTHRELRAVVATTFVCPNAEERHADHS